MRQHRFKRQITYGWSAFCLDVELKLAFKKHIKHIVQEQQIILCCINRNNKASDFSGSKRNCLCDVVSLTGNRHLNYLCNSRRRGWCSDLRCNIGLFGDRLLSRGFFGLVSCIRITQDAAFNQSQLFSAFYEKLCSMVLN